MSVVESILSRVELPRFAPVRQHFSRDRLDPDAIRRRIADQVRSEGLLSAIRQGDVVAITAGSRGIRHIDAILRAVADLLRERGASPYVVACMGSHGGAAAGQKRVLEHLGVTEESVGAPVVASDELAVVGTACDGRTVYADAGVCRADALVVVNRVKPHTAFRAPVESGLQKMLAIGLGKQKGADACHEKGFDGMYENITRFAEVVLGRLCVPFGVGILENAYGDIRDCVALPGAAIPREEPKLLLRARELMPRLFIDSLDVLVVSEMGKDISGSGMDTNVIGRYPTPYLSGGPSIGRIAALDLTEASRGSAHGVGFADFVSEKLFAKMDRDMTYPNCLTNKVAGPAKIPPIMPNDKCAVAAAVKTCANPGPETIRAMWIRNTHDLETVYVSSALLDEVGARPDMTVLAEARELPFTGAGELNWLEWSEVRT